MKIGIATSKRDYAINLGIAANKSEWRFRNCVILVGLLCIALVVGHSIWEQKPLIGMGITILYSSVMLGYTAIMFIIRYCRDRQLHKANNGDLRDVHMLRRRLGIHENLNPTDAMLYGIIPWGLFNRFTLLPLAFFLGSVLHKSDNQKKFARAIAKHLVDQGRLYQLAFISAVGEKHGDNCKLVMTELDELRKQACLARPGKRSKRRFGLIAEMSAVAMILSVSAVSYACESDTTLYFIDSESWDVGGGVRVEVPTDRDYLPIEQLTIPGSNHTTPTYTIERWATIYRYDGEIKKQHGIASGVVFTKVKGYDGEDFSLSAYPMYGGAMIPFGNGQFFYRWDRDIDLKNWRDFHSNPEELKAKLKAYWDNWRKEQKEEEERAEAELREQREETKRQRLQKQKEEAEAETNRSWLDRTFGD